MVSEDRKMFGLALGRNILENISLVNLHKYIHHILIRDREIAADALTMKELLNIKVSDFKVDAKTLSGGNQQKIVLAKWLLGQVKIMILDEPTRGIDVGAKSEIHKLMTDFARKGMGIIMISSELPEVLGMSDRIAVMQEGRINGILPRSEATPEAIMKLATQGQPLNTNFADTKSSAKTKQVS
jgi:inositol transport system ATP-binding protein